MSKILLMGNKNVGKTTFYNIITNQNEKIANVSGSTVDIKCFKKDENILFDLPGVDCFNPQSYDEKLVLDYLLTQDFDQINLILDTNNISKSANLLIEILELNLPTNIYLHQSDNLQNINNLKNVFEKFSNLNVFVTTQKNTSQIKTLWKKTAKVNKDFSIDYGYNVENLILKISEYIDNKIFNKRFVAIQILQGNKYFLNNLNIENKLTILSIIKKNNENSKTALSLIRSIQLARKMQIDKLIKHSQVIIKPEKKSTQIIDSILINPWIGPLLFILLVLANYFISIEIIGIPLQNLWVENLEKIGLQLSQVMQNIHVYSWVQSLINDVFIGSLGTIIGFIPMILSIYFFNSLFENTGYNYRASILFDNILSKFGLDGRSIISVMSGFGCNVPAILSTRIQKSKLKRIIAILVLVFVPCVARIPMISLFASLFFKSWHFMFVFTFNILIICIIFISSLILNKTKFKNNDHTLLFEYPKLKLPNLKYIFKLSWKTSLNYVNKIFTTLLIGALVVWFLTSFGFNGYNSKQPFINYLLPLTSWIFKPFMIKDDRFSGLLIVGFSVKELLLSTIPVMFNENNINHVLVSNLNTAQAYAILLFFILYTPCLSTYLTIKKEISQKIANFSLIFSFIVAYVCSYLIYLLISLFI